MAHKKAAGSTQLGRESESKRLGVKIYAGQPARPGQIIIRQRGTHYHPGDNVRRGSDDTLYAVLGGLVTFSTRTVKNFTGKLTKRKFVGVKAGK